LKRKNKATMPDVIDKACVDSPISSRRNKSNARKINRKDNDGYNALLTSCDRFTLGISG